MAIVQQANSFPALGRKEQSDSPLAKFLQAFKHTISKVVERVGHYIQSVPITKLVTQGIEKEQGHLETLLSIN